MKKPILLLASGLLVACGSSNAPVAGALNPGVTQDNIYSTICVKGWTKTIRPPVSYTQRLKKSQLPVGANLRDYEEDHIIPLELGGAPQDERNLRPVAKERADEDDKQENALHKQVCSGKLTLLQAQEKISQLKEGE